MQDIEKERKMKKIVLITICLVLVISVLAGCGNTGTPAPTPSPAINTDAIEGFKTIGDLKAAKIEDIQIATYEDSYVYVFSKDNTVYRVIASITKETAQEIWDLDFLDEHYAEKSKELTDPLEIKVYENLSILIPTQEELDKLVGMTGGELIKDGWENRGYYIDDGQIHVFMLHEIFAYIIAFDGEPGIPIDSEEFADNLNEAIQNMTVKNIEYDGIGEATNVEGISF